MRAWSDFFVEGNPKLGGYALWGQGTWSCLSLFVKINNIFRSPNLHFRETCFKRGNNQKPSSIKKLPFKPDHPLKVRVKDVCLNRTADEFYHRLHWKGSRKVESPWGSGVKSARTSMSRTNGFLCVCQTPNADSTNTLMSLNVWETLDCFLPAARV